MAGDYNRDGDRKRRRAHSCERGRRDNRDSNYDRRGGSRSSSREDRRDDPPRSGPLVCFGCRVTGHYRTDCWRYWTDPIARRQMEADGFICPLEYIQRSTTGSPPRDGVQPRVVAEDHVPGNHLDELGRTVASIQEFIELERARRTEREQQARECKEARRVEAEARAAEAERAARKAEKQRKREEQMKMAKAVEVQLSLRLGDIREEIKTEVRRDVAGTLVKSQTKTFVNATGKGKEAAVQDVPSSSGVNNEVEAITEGTGSLSIQEKRKRGDVEIPVEDSPPVITLAKRTNKRLGVRPIRLSDRLQRSRSRIPVRKTNRRVATKALTAVKPSAPDALMDRKIFLDNTRRDLSKIDYDTLRSICREEGVNYATKVHAIFDIADILPNFEAFQNLAGEANQSSNEGSDEGAAA
ncbi:hypothetical protein CBR_g4716 [Chara braunii]|uniref:Uncharacterized protein n=1 Tax=Chara braunii TaxID=69332 RepID=A0A388KIP7_CHABU|nr:hypothetical protein CBR_g4716 [Chara braunii]|eukprot:GBG69888.1 hypothetical protein CBR_g4716 [Chara braunii]